MCTAGETKSCSHLSRKIVHRKHATNAHSLHLAPLGGNYSNSAFTKEKKNIAKLSAVWVFCVSVGSRANIPAMLMLQWVQRGNGPTTERREDFQDACSVTCVCFQPRC